MGKLVNWSVWWYTVTCRPPVYHETLEEYFLFDPFGEYLTPWLVGFRLAKWSYR